MARVVGFREERTKRGGWASFPCFCLRGKRPKRRPREEEGEEVEVEVEAETELLATTSNTTLPGSSLAALTLPWAMSLRNCE